VITIYKPGNSDRVAVFAKRLLTDRVRRERSRPG